MNERVSEWATYQHRPPWRRELCSTSWWLFFSFRRWRLATTCIIEYNEPTLVYLDYFFRLYTALEINQSWSTLWNQFDRPLESCEYRYKVPPALWSSAHVRLGMWSGYRVWGSEQRHLHCRASHAPAICSRAGLTKTLALLPQLVWFVSVPTCFPPWPVQSVVPCFVLPSAVSWLLCAWTWYELTPWTRLLNLWVSQISPTSPTQLSMPYQTYVLYNSDWMIVYRMPSNMKPSLCLDLYVC